MRLFFDFSQNLCYNNKNSKGEKTMAIANKMEATWEMSFTDFYGNEHSVHYTSVSDEVNEHEIKFGMENVVKAIGMLADIDEFGEYSRVIILPVNLDEYMAVKDFLDDYRKNRK